MRGESLDALDAQNEDVSAEKFQGAQHEGGDDRNFLTDSDEAVEPHDDEDHRRIAHRSCSTFMVKTLKDLLPFARPCSSRSTGGQM